MELQNNEPQIQLYAFDEKKNCFASITLPDGKTQISGIKVICEPSGNVTASMPEWMHSVWSHPDVPWDTVKKLITDKYTEVLKIKAAYKAQRSKAPVQLPQISLYDRKRKKESMATVTLTATETKIRDIYVACDCGEEGSVYVGMPAWMKREWQYDEAEWSWVSELVIREYERQINGKDLPAPENAAVLFKSVREIYTCMADITLPNGFTCLKGFKIREFRTGYIQVEWHNKWSSRTYSWHQICTHISNEYKKAFGITATPKKPTAPASDTAPAAQPKNENAAPKVQKETTEFGTIKNAENSPFIFYPRTVLRLAETDQELSAKKKIYDLATSLAKGGSGNIGALEINLLLWVTKLRYTTSAMLSELIEAKYISAEQRINFNKNKLSDTITKMSKYNLITLTNFVTVSDDEKEANISSAKLRIITLGSLGNTLLRELEKDVPRYNAFDILQDGNKVKRFLTSNQWLIYWLTTFGENIGENYETAYVLQRKGVEYCGARLYATVTVNDSFPIVAEPVRRDEIFEIESGKKHLREKVRRMANIFGQNEQLYNGTVEVTFPSRPVITFICEDDEHITEVWDNLKEILEENPEQEVWFTTDLRIFNEEHKGQRFLRIENGEKLTIDLGERLGIEE